jgi:hypothetical protein
MVEDTSFLFVTGPDVVKSVTGETVTQEVCVRECHELLFTRCLS